MGVKKVSEYALKEENENLGAALGILNALTEHADTRNWQSLPNNIQYSRIPLVEGKNNITIEFMNTDSTALIKNITVQGNGNIQFQKVITLESKPSIY